MPVGRYFRGLTAYDLLGILVPGVIALIAVMGFIPYPPIPENIGGYALFAIIAFCVGAIVQAHASTAVGDRESFNKTMEGVERLPSLSNLIDEENEEDEVEEENNLKESEESKIRDRIYRFLVNILHAFFGPLFWWTRSPRGEELEDVILVNRIWGHLVDNYDIPYNTESFGVLYHLMSSKVDDMNSPSRATRIQALRNFHRGMWIASWYLFLALTIALLLDYCFAPRDTIYSGIEYYRPAFFTYWTPVWHLLIIVAIAVAAFWYLFESSEEDYIEYLFTDYAVGITTGSTKLSFEENPEVELSGSVSTTLQRNGGREEEKKPED